MWWSMNEPKSRRGKGREMTEASLVNELLDLLLVLYDVKLVVLLKLLANLRAQHAVSHDRVSTPGAGCPTIRLDMARTRHSS